MAKQRATRWLSAEEQAAWRGFLAATREVLEAVSTQMAKESGLPHGYYEILVRLSEAPGRALRMSDLAEASLSSRSRLSHAVARLEERGWVRRTCHPDDRRGQVAELTDEGFAVLESAAPGHVETVRAAFIDPLTPEQLRQLRTITEAIAGRLQAGRQACEDDDAR
jgi:DNA-binding MarR family transcriptional regulator